MTFEKNILLCAFAHIFLTMLSKSFALQKTFQPNVPIFDANIEYSFFFKYTVEFNF